MTVPVDVPSSIGAQPWRRGAAVLAAAAALALGACGTPSPDLFVVQRDGTVPGAKLNLLVSDTTTRCNGGPTRPLTSAQTLEARDITTELLKVQSGKVAMPPAPPAQIFRFSVRTQDGTLRYGDTTRRPEVLPRLTLFVRQLATGVCGLQR